jgi:medium-chain acyl-[acyl-carrier-protein] hydrolase
MKFVSERDFVAPGVRLFCLPHAGSGSAGFYRWKRESPSGMAVCPVMLPGREARLAETALKSVDEIVSALMTELRDEMAQPYAIFGHSMSALIAFEWARAAEREGLRGPEVLFVSGREAPLRELGHRELHKLGDESMLRALEAKYGGDANEVLADTEMREVFVPIVRADLTVVETYKFVAGEKLECAVRAFAGASDKSVGEEGLKAWGDVTSGSFEARRFSGDHFFHLGEARGELLETIAAELKASSK